MTDTPIDPAATPDEDDSPEIAADDAGASAAAERAGKGGVEGTGGAEGDEGMAGEGV